MWEISPSQVSNGETFSDWLSKQSHGRWCGLIWKWICLNNTLAEEYYFHWATLPPLSRVRPGLCHLRALQQWTSHQTLKSLHFLSFEKWIITQTSFTSQGWCENQMRRIYKSVPQTVKGYKIQGKVVKRYFVMESTAFLFSPHSML